MAPTGPRQDFVPFHDPHTPALATAPAGDPLTKARGYASTRPRQSQCGPIYIHGVVRTPHTNGPSPRRSLLPSAAGRGAPAPFRGGGGKFPAHPPGTRAKTSPNPSARTKNFPAENKFPEVPSCHTVSRKKRNPGQNAAPGRAARSRRDVPGGRLGPQRDKKSLLPSHHKWHPLGRGRILSRFMILTRQHWPPRQQGIH